MRRLRDSVIMGLFCGVAFGIYGLFVYKPDVAIVGSSFLAVGVAVMSYFKMFSKVDYTVKFLPIPKAEIEYSGMASHWLGDVSAGGTLYLLKDQLVFQTNAINYTARHQLIIPLTEVVAVDLVKTMKVVNNGLLITSRDAEEKFVAYNREHWKRLIEKKITTIRSR